MAKLLKLHLENYRALKSADFDFAGQSGKIIGMNRIGKTTVIEAIEYLLTDKLIGNVSDIASIKNHENPKAHVVVEGTFLTEDGEVTLRKEFYEKWVRPRGSATEELVGHSTDYYVNGAKQARASDFFEAVSAKFGIPTSWSGLDSYQLVTNPFYLGQIICGSKDWKLARKAVIAIIGDVTPEEIFQANKDTAIVKEDLIAHQYDDAETKKALNAEIEGYKKQILLNDGSIQEQNRVEDADEAEYTVANDKEKELSQQIAKLNSGYSDPYAEEVSKINNELFELQSEYQKAVGAPVSHEKSEAIRSELNAKRKQLSVVTAEQYNANNAIASLVRSMDEKRKLRDELIAKIKDLETEYKAIYVEDVCPTCGQHLPQEQIEAAFNKKKAEIIAKAQDFKAQAEENKKAMAEDEANYDAFKTRDFDSEITELKNAVIDLENQLAKAEAEEAASIKKPDPAIQERIAKLNERLGEIRRLKAEGSAGVQDQIRDLEAKRSECIAVLSKRLAFQSARKRIAELQGENANLGKKQADAEQRLWAVGQYVKTKLGLLDSHMASKFGEVRFQLIKENIKAGSYDEVCVPFIINPITGKCTTTLFQDGSKSEQIYTGIQIINSICNAKGWESLPIVIDQGGELDFQSVVRVKVGCDAQIIAVKVEGNGKEPTFVPFDN